MNWKAFGLTSFIMLIIFVVIYCLITMPHETAYFISKIGAIGILITSAFGFVYFLYKMISLILEIK